MIFRHYSLNYVGYFFCCKLGSQQVHHRISCRLDVLYYVHSVRTVLFILTFCIMFIQMAFCIYVMDSIEGTG